MIFVETIKLFTIALLGTLLALLPYSRAFAAVSSEQETANGIVIFQLQTASSSSASHEYISIYNNSSQPVDITGWRLVYASSTGNTTTELGTFTAGQNNHRLLLNPYSTALAGTAEFQSVHPQAALNVTFNAGIAGTSGHVRLLNSDDVQQDAVGYGSAAYPETLAKAAPATGKILQRSMLNGQIAQDTNNNSLDFISTDLFIAQLGTYEEYQEPQIIDVPSILLSEVLPNPAGTDTGREYIEFYNPTPEAVSLKNYTLELGPAYNKSYALPDIVIESQQYIALTDQETSITLPNTSASLRLVDVNGVELMVMPTYNQLPDDVVWARNDNNVWQASYVQTPSAANEFLDSKPCANGYARNTNSGVCQKTTSASIKSSTACPVGQIRNTETNRCRKIVTAVESAVCEAGKIKNPQTGRCKKIETTAAQKACPAGQERHTETNRCRKTVAKASSVPAVKDVSTPVVENNAQWWAAGLAGSGSVSYAAYEWRQEVRRKLDLFKSFVSHLFNK